MPKLLLSTVLGPSLLLGFALPVAGTGAQGQAQEAVVESAPRPIALPDILSWKAIRDRALSPDGRWFAYVLQPNEGDSEIVVRSVQGSQEYRFDGGERAPFGGGGALRFSDDSAWFAFAIQPSMPAAPSVPSPPRTRPVATSRCGAPPQPRPPTPSAPEPPSPPTPPLRGRVGLSSQKLQAPRLVGGL